MTVKVTTDVSRVLKGMAKFARDFDRATTQRGYENAQRTAAEIHGTVPVLTGKLVSTVKASRTPVGGDVHYGGTLPYARKIERRGHAVANALANAPSSFRRAMIAVAEQEVSRL